MGLLVFCSHMSVIDFRSVFTIIEIISFVGYKLATLHQLLRMNFVFLEFFGASEKYSICPYFANWTYLIHLSFVIWFLLVKCFPFELDWGLVNYA